MNRSHTLNGEHGTSPCGARRSFEEFPSMEDRKYTRVDLLKALAVAPFAAAAVASVSSEADAKGTKAAYKYVDHPVKNQKCAGCSLYIPNPKDPAKARGGCKVVDGSISPNGWCISYVPKAH